MQNIDKHNLVIEDEYLRRVLKHYQTNIIYMKKYCLNYSIAAKLHG